MDPEAFLDVANQVTKLKMYPYFDLAHSAVCLLAIREDLGNGEQLMHVSSIHSPNHVKSRINFS